MDNCNIDRKLDERAEALFARISLLIETARKNIASTVNITMVYANFETGKYIVEDEQQGAHRAEYGKSVLKQLSQKLIEKYLVNVEGYYKYSSNIRNLLFKPSANTRIYDRIRLSFNSTEKYISDLNEIYEKLESEDRFFGFISFNKKQWTLILNDLMILYPDIEFI